MTEEEEGRAALLEGSPCPFRRNRHMELIVRLTECTGDPDDEAVGGGELSSEVDLVAGGVLDENVQIWDLVSNADKSRPARVKAAGGGGAACHGSGTKTRSEGHV